MFGVIFSPAAAAAPRETWPTRRTAMENNCRYPEIVTYDHTSIQNFIKIGNLLPKQTRRAARQPSHFDPIISDSFLLQERIGRDHHRKAKNKKANHRWTRNPLLYMVKKQRQIQNMCFKKKKLKSSRANHTGGEAHEKGFIKSILSKLSFFFFLSGVTSIKKLLILACFSFVSSCSTLNLDNHQF